MATPVTSAPCEVIMDSLIIGVAIVVAVLGALVAILGGAITSISAKVNKLGSGID